MLKIVVECTVQCWRAAHWFVAKQRVVFSSSPSLTRQEVNIETKLHTTCVF